METPPPPSKARRRLGLGLLLLGLALIVVHELVLSVYLVRGVSMLPALHDGERVVVLKRFYEVGRGDRLVFHNPNAPDEILVKRVLFLPGERFEVHDHRIEVHGPHGAAREVQVGYLKPGVDGLGRIPASVVPDDSFFLVGDNLGESIDSRVLGAIPRRLVIGKVIRTLGR